MRSREGQIRRVPIQVPIDDEVVIAPVTAEKRPVIRPVDDVAIEREGEMIFGARALKLLDLSLGEDVVANDVLSAVMLMETARHGPIDEIVGHGDVGRAFIRVEAPPAVIERVDIMDDIVMHGRAG